MAIRVITIGTRRACLLIFFTHSLSAVPPFTPIPHSSVNASHQTYCSSPRTESYRLTHALTCLAKSRNDTPLLCAARTGQETIVRMLLETASSTINNANVYGRTALMEAIKYNQTAVALLLLQHPYSSLKTIDTYGTTLLMACVESGNTRLLHALFAHKDYPDIDINHADNKGNTALIIATSKGDIALVKRLLKLPGIAINHANNQGDTSLTIAACYPHTEALINIFMEHSAIHLNHANNQGETVLSLTLRHQSFDIFKWVLARINSTTLNRKNLWKETPLQQALTRGSVPHIKALVDTAGIELTSEDLEYPIPVTGNRYTKYRTLGNIVLESTQPK